MMMIEDAFGHWFAGLTDGEGCFSFFDGRYPRFQIALREDDEPVLQYVIKTLGVGKLYRSNRVKDRNNGVNRRDTLTLLIRGPHIKSIIIPIFERYQLRSKKRIKFEEWKTKIPTDIKHWKRRASA